MNALETTLKQLRLSGLSQTLDVRLQEAAANRLSHAEFLELICQDELNVRQQRLMARHTKLADYPERHAQSHLGHGSKAVARTYARKAKVKTPPLEDYEEAQRQSDGKIVPFPRDVDVEGQRVANSLQVSNPSLN